MKPTLLIPAAGLGSRYGGLKQLDPVGPGGETIMDYSIYDALRAGFGKLVFVIRRDLEAPFKQTIGGAVREARPGGICPSRAGQTTGGVPRNHAHLWRFVHFECQNLHCLCSLSVV